MFDASLFVLSGDAAIVAYEGQGGKGAMIGVDGAKHSEKKRLGRRGKGLDALRVPLREGGGSIDLCQFEQGELDNAVAFLEHISCDS